MSVVSWHYLALRFLRLTQPSAGECESQAPRPAPAIQHILGLGRCIDWKYTYVWHNIDSTTSCASGQLSDWTQELLVSPSAPLLDDDSRIPDTSNVHPLPTRLRPDAGAANESSAFNCLHIPTVVYRRYCLGIQWVQRNSSPDFQCGQEPFCIIRLRVTT